MRLCKNSSVPETIVWRDVSDENAAFYHVQLKNRIRGIRSQATFAAFDEALVQSICAEFLSSTIMYEPIWLDTEAIVVDNFNSIACSEANEYFDSRNES